MSDDAAALLATAVGSLLLVGAAWRSPQPKCDGSPAARVALPIAFTVASFGLVLYEAFTDLDVLGVALIRLTLLAVVVRLGLTLWWLSRQRADLEARKEALYRQIRDAELDREQGKLTDADWKRLDDELRREAIEVLKRIDALAAGRT